MAKASKLPSGAWRVQASKNVNGKRIVRSFTVHPDETKGDSRKAKQKAELLARQWQIEKEQQSIYSMTVGQALEEYINDRSKVLSPRTIYDYKSLVPFFDSISDIYVEDIRTCHIQALVNEWSVSVTAKTIKNRTGLLLPALDYAECDKKFRIRYPKSRPVEIKAPDIQDVQRLLNNSDDDFRPILYLAAFGSLRRGEICGLHQCDVSRDMCSITVNGDMVKTEKGWIYKSFPKTSGSIRTIHLPKEIINSLPITKEADALLFENMNPNQLSKRYDKLRHKCDIESNFHSLRHFAASFRSDLGIPRKYIEEVGGWKNESQVLARVYDNTLSSTRKKYVQITNQYIVDTFMNDKQNIV